MLRGSDALLDPSLQYLTSAMKSEVSSIQFAYVTDIFADVLLVGISSWSRMMLGTVGINVCACMFYSIAKNFLFVDMI